MFNVLQAKGIPSRFVTFPDENHVGPSSPSPILYPLHPLLFQASALIPLSSIFTTPNPCLCTSTCLMSPSLGSRDSIGNGGARSPESANEENSGC